MPFDYEEDTSSSNAVFCHKKHKFSEPKVQSDNKENQNIFLEI